MKTSQTIKIWKKFLKERREIEEEVLEEEEPFQKDVKKGYLKDRDDYLTSGPQKTHGAPFDKNPKRSRAESSPPPGKPVAEGLLDRIKNVFGGRKAAGKTAQDQDGDLNFDLNTKEVDISIENGKYTGTGEEALKDREVLRLVAAFVQQVPEVNVSELEQMIKLDPTRGIRFLLNQTGVRNTAEPGEGAATTTEPQEDPSKSDEVSIQNDVIPKLRGISKQDKYKTKALKDLAGYKIVNLPKKEVGKDHIIDILRVNKFSEEEVEELISVMDNKKIVKENLSINNVSGADLAELMQNINKFYPYAQEYLKFDRPASLNLVSDPNNAKDAFGKTAYYNPNNDEITIFVDKRHPKDMIRSFSHELVHHAQNCRGEFDKEFVAGENYIEHNDHLNLMEREAYEKGNMCLRYYESYLKKENKKMNLNEETLRKAIREAIKRVTENKATTEETVAEETVTEDSGEEESEHDRENVHDDDHHIREIERHLDALKDDRNYEDEEEHYDHDKYNECVNEDAAEELGDDVDTEKGLPSDTTGKPEFMKEEDLDEETGTLKESFNQAKGKLIFNRLVDKWCK